MDNLTQIKTTLYALLAALLVAVAVLVLIPREKTDVQHFAADGQETAEPEKTEHTEHAEKVETAQEDAPAAPVTTTVHTGGAACGAQYKLVEAEGVLWVYLVADDSLYMETGISFELLPSAVQTQIRKGKYFGSDTELYEFLESYSS